MTNGSVTLNGVTDKELVVILEAKIRNEGKIGFLPASVQQGGGSAANPLNNQVLVTWPNEEGFKAVVHLLADLANHRLVAKDAA
jgi:hypothetical protein